MTIGQPAPDHAAPAAGLRAGAGGGDAPTDHAALVLALRAGDHDALDRLYRDWFDRAVALARRLTGRDESFALDVAQDAFLRLIRSPPDLSRRVNDPANPASDSQLALDRWMTCCVHSAAIDRLRRDARRSARERSRERVTSADHSANHRAGPAATPLDALALAESIEQQLRQLCGDDRLLLSQHLVHARGVTAMARLLNVTVGTVNGRLRRLLAGLRAPPDEHLDGPPRRLSPPRPGSGSAAQPRPRTRPETHK